MTDRERAICSRIKDVREQVKWSQSDFARELRISRAKLVSIEYGHTPLRYDLAYKICRNFNIQAKWLVTGAGDMRPFSSLKWSLVKLNQLRESDLLSRVYDINSAVFEASAQSKMRQRNIPADFDFNQTVDEYVWLFCKHLKFNDHNSAWEFAEKLLNYLKAETGKVLEKRQATRTSIDLRAIPFYISSQASSPKTENQNLTNAATQLESALVTGRWLNLKKQIQTATADVGSKSKLAKFLGVDLTQLSKWLTDSNSAREPGAEYTLQMQAWVNDLKRQ